jgi:predicted alpha-1,2-mannosidase
MFKKKDRILAITLVVTLLISSLQFGGLSVPAQAMAEPLAGEDYTQYVDPFVGTQVDNGQLFPGSVVPNGLVKLSPDTFPHNTLDHAGYDYNKTQIAGFSHTRIEGVGGQGAGGDVLITPTYVQYTTKPTAVSKAQNFSHAKEAASPGYYSVELTPKTGTGTSYSDNTAIGNIKAELTSDTRTGYHKYTFPQDGMVSLIVDLNYTYHGTDIRNAIMNVEQLGSTTAVSGRFSGKNVSGHGKYTMYFYMETNQPAVQVKTWLDSSFTGEAKREGNDIGAVLTFQAAAAVPLEVKVSISPVSCEQAKKDMYREIPDWNFDLAHQHAKELWNAVLGKVKVENSAQSDPDGRLKKLFYTHLYHMFTTPVNATSTDNTFRATDLNIYEADDYIHYDSWTLWDDFRKYPMIGLVLPEVYKDYIRSIANTMEYGIGTWGIATQTVPTVRTEHAVALLADGVAKGFDDIDNFDKAYVKSKEIANATVNTAAESLGYIEGRVDKTVEFSYDDWAISLLAKNLGNAADYNKYLARSFYYKNLYKADAVNTTVNGVPKTFGLLWPKDTSGNWKSANPEGYGNNSLYQGTLWQYTWWDSNDVNGLLDLIGSRELMAEELQYLYGMQDPDNGSRMLHTNTNEIDLHTPYLFNFVGQPYYTQYWVRQIYTKQTWNRYAGDGEYSPPVYDYVYKLDPAGFMRTMDDDAGTMAAMYVAAAMGLFPMTPGDTTFQIGTPFFEKITLDVGNGREFVIEANNVSSDNFYIQSAALNGESLNRTWIDYSEIIRGGTLSFEMGDKASDWAVDGVTALSSSDMVDTSVYDKADPLKYSTATIFEADSNDGAIEEELVISLQNTAATMTGAAGEDLITSGKVVIGNVPAGLTAQAVKVDASSIKISFAGKALSHKLNDSIGNLSIHLEDSLFSEVISSKRKVKDNVKIMFSDDTIRFSKKKLAEAAANDGTMNDSVAVSLTGDTVFSGTAGEDFVSSGKVKLSNLPAGLTAQAKMLDNQTIELSVAGKAIEHNADVDDLVITFEDAAFTGDRACQINGSNYGGMQSLILDFIGNWEERLEQLIAAALLLDPSEMTTSDYNKILAAVQKGQQVVADHNSAEENYEKAYNELYNAMYDLTPPQSGLNKLEAENYNLWSGGGDLKVESGTDSGGTGLTNLGGSYNGAWIGYEKVDFGTKDIATFSIRYVNNSGRCVPDASVEIHLGSPNGELLQTVALPSTGSSWNAYSVKTVDIAQSEKLTGIVNLYFVLKGTGAVGTGSGQVFVANIDWMQFKEANSYGIYQAEKYNSWSGGALKTESTTTSEGESLINLGGTYPNAWISYEKIRFSGGGLGKVAIRYAGNTGRCVADARIELRLDSLTGTLVDTIPIPPNAASWNIYTTVEKNISANVQGLHDVYLILKGSGSNPYVANIDYFEFKEIEYEVTATSGENGTATVTPNKVKAGGSATVEIDPDNGYGVDQVLVNGVAVDFQGHGDQAVTYTVSNITQDTNINVSFKLIQVGSVTPSAIQVTTLPDKLVYKVGEALDLTGIVVTAIYAEGNTAVIDDYQVVTQNPTSAEGTIPIVISYKEVTTTFDITVLSVNVTPTALSVTAMPSKLVYAVGEALDLSGIEVTVTYSDESTAVVNDYLIVTQNPTGAEGTIPVEISYGELTATFDITVISANVTPTALNVTAMPSKLVYVVGETLDLSGVEVTVTYSDGSTAVVNDYLVVTQNPTSAEGTIPVVISYGDLTATFDITVTPANVTPTALNVTAMPSKLVYAIGEALDLSGIEVTVTYSDESTAVVNDYLVVTQNPTGAEGTIPVIISYGDLTATFDITVTPANVTPTALNITAMPSKLVYVVGEALDLSGMEVTATYSDGSAAVVNNYLVVTQNPTSAEGTIPVVISYGDVTATFDITVNAPVPASLSAISITTLPGKLVYRVGDALDLSGMVVTAAYTDGSTAVITGYQVDTVNPTGTAGTVNVVISYLGVTASFSIRVEASQGSSVVTPDPVILNKLVIAKNPDKTQYYVGEAIDLSGLQVSAVYSNGLTNLISSYSVNSDGVTATAGTKTITVSYSGANASFTVTVIKPELTLDITSATMKTGESLSLSPGVKPEDLKVSYQYSSSDSSVASVSSDGKVTANSDGTAIITVSIGDGMSVTCKVTVLPEVKEIVLIATKKTLGVGEKFTLTYELSPVNISGKVTYKSGNPSIATINSKGEIKAKKSGTVKITVTAENGVTQTCTITVKKAPAYVKADKSAVSLKVKKTSQIKIVLSEGSAGKVTYTSSNKSIVTVDSKGKVTGKKSGTAYITVKTYNGKTVKVKVTVTGK